MLVDFLGFLYLGLVCVVYVVGWEFGGRLMVVVVYVDVDLFWLVVFGDECYVVLGVGLVYWILLGWFDVVWFDFVVWFGV